MTDPYNYLCVFVFRIYPLEKNAKSFIDFGVGGRGGRRGGKVKQKVDDSATDCKSDD